MTNNINGQDSLKELTTFKDVAFLSYQMKKRLIALGDMIQNLPPSLQSLIEPLSDIYEVVMNQVTPPGREGASVKAFGNWYVNAISAEKKAYFDTLDLLTHNPVIQHQMAVVLALDMLAKVEDEHKYTDIGACYDFAAIQEIIGQLKE